MAGQSNNTVEKGDLSFKFAIIVAFIIILTVDMKTSYSTNISVQEDNGWTNMAPQTVPQPRVDSDMIYDVKADRLILFSGLKLLAGMKFRDTWSYDFNSNTWTNMSSLNTPIGREAHSMAYDEESDRTILFSGLKLGPWDWVCWNETWAYNFNDNTWIAINSPTQPSGRAHADMVYDKDSDRIILFGGFNGDTIYGETWAYDFNTKTWTNMSPSVYPSPRWGHKMVYDKVSDRIILFGGSIGLPGEVIVRNDTWLYDYNTNTWTNVTPVISPPGLQSYGLAYDTKSDRVILFGGSDQHLVDSDETWVYDCNTNSWVNERSNMPLSRRRRVSMAYDEESDRVILFGGCYDGYKLLNETWACYYQTKEEMSSETSTTSHSTSDSTSTLTSGLTPSFTLLIGFMTFSALSIYRKCWKKARKL